VWVSSFRWRLATRSARRCFSAHFGHCALCEFFGGVGGMRESRHQAQRRRLYVIELSATGEQKALAICVRCLPPLRGASSDCTAGCCCVCKHEKANQGRFRLHGAECCHVRGCTQTHTNTHTGGVCKRDRSSRNAVWLSAARQAWWPRSANCGLFPVLGALASDSAQ
jgi:hypothetical protein